MSHDAEQIVFRSSATDLVPGATQPGQHLYLRDFTTDTMILVDSDEAFDPAISADGRIVVYQSQDQIRRRILDEPDTAIEIVSLGFGRLPGDSVSHNATLSPHGLFIAFATHAANIFRNDTSGEDVVLLQPCEE